MDPIIFAVAVGTLAVGNAICMWLLTKQRKALDLSKPDEAKRAHGLKLLTYFLPFEAFVISVILYIALMGGHA